MVGVVEFGAEHGGEVRVLEVGAVDAVVELARGGIGLVERVPIPLGVHRFALRVDRRVRGNGIDAPMYKDAELGIRVPPGRRARIDGFPGGLKTWLAEGSLSGGSARGAALRRSRRRICPMLSGGGAAGGVNYSQTPLSRSNGSGSPQLGSSECGCAGLMR